MMHKKITLLFILLFITFFVNANIYYCPSLPIKVTIGETIENNWFVWPLNDKISTVNIYYYKFFKKEFSFDFWDAFPHGKYSGKFEGPSNYVACCGWLKKEKYLVCALKAIAEKNCEEKITGPGREYFSCEKNNKES